MTRRRVLIDAGNSTLKWAVIEDGRWRAQGRCNYVDWSGLQEQLAEGVRCFIASVARPVNEKQLEALLASAGVVSSWLKAGTDFDDLKNTYLQPPQLGVDRWMGLIAARQRTRGPALVVSVGTAMTVDALTADGEFLGGLIVPGAALMRQALLQGAAQIADVSGQWTPFPRCTADAVESGIVAALCGAIHQQYGRLNELTGVSPLCLLTGGDTEMVRPFLSVPAEPVPALILEGIDCVARAEGLS